MISFPQLQNDVQGTSEDMTLPITKQKLVTFMTNRPQFYNLTAFDVNAYNEYLQVPNMSKRVRSLYP